MLSVEGTLIARQ